MKIVEINGVKYNLEKYSCFKKSNKYYCVSMLEGIFVLAYVPGGAADMIEFDTEEARDKFWDEELPIT
jgi:hypothetical protein